MPDIDAMNLNIGADVTQMKAAMLEMAGSMKQLTGAAQNVAQATGQWDVQIYKAGRTLTGIGRGGIFIGIYHGLRNAIEMSKQWDAELQKIVKTGETQRKTIQSLAQSWGKRVAPDEAARLTKAAVTLGAGAGLDLPQAIAAARTLQPRLRRMDEPAKMAAMETYFQLIGRGVDPAAAARVARRGPAAADPFLRRAGQIEAATLTAFPAVGGFHETARRRATAEARMLTEETEPARKTRETAVGEAIESTARRLWVMQRGGGDPGDKTDWKSLIWREFMAGRPGEALTLIHLCMSGRIVSKWVQTIDRLGAAADNMNAGSR